jgi:hypothetical protein
MGRVFLGESGSGRRVAVKLVREELAATPGFRDRFRREAELAMRAGGFYAAAVVDADPDAVMPWIASQYIDGPSLSERVTQQGPLDEPEVRGLGTGLAEALASFHRGGLVHRDLKPSNVLLVDDGPRIIDFGISKALETTGDSDLTKTGTVLGTPGFMSPEQALGQPAGPPSDVFSLGSLLVYAATGTGAFGTGTSHALLFRLVYEEADLSAIPDGLRELTRDCLQKTPEDRPAADDLVARLAQGPRTTVLKPPARKAGREAGPESGSEADALATTGPQQQESPSASTRPPAPTDRRSGPVEEAKAPLTFTVEEWGSAVFWRRMRRPALTALTIDVLLLVAGAVFDTAGTAALAVIVTLLYLLYGLKVSLPLLRARALRVGADGLFVRHGRHTLTVPWRDIASITCSGEKNKHRLALTAALKEGTGTEVPYSLRAGKGALKCTIVSAWKGETIERMDGLETALRDFAGGHYLRLPVAR